jgi:hypothetical protein
MLYKKINVELIVVADEADAVALESGFAFGIRLKISSNLFAASDSRFIPAS